MVKSALKRHIGRLRETNIDMPSAQAADTTGTNRGVGQRHARMDYQGSTGKAFANMDPKSHEPI